MELLYEGKAKKIYRDQNPSTLLVEYKDSLTAFNALKKGSFEDKGKINCEITQLIFEYLEKHGIPTHWVETVNSNTLRVKKVSIIPLEVVVRNTLAGSTAKKLGITEGKVLDQPLVEFYFKNDELQDPFVSDDQVLMLQVATAAEIEKLKTEARQINRLIKNLFFEIGIDLIDFKIEFGRTEQGQILLADEITPDCCRLWDLKTQEKMDKDRFRRDLGNVRESYVEVLQRLRKQLKR